MKERVKESVKERATCRLERSKSVSNVCIGLEDDDGS